MKELVQFLATSLVDEPSAVDVEEKATPEGARFLLQVSPSDLGKVIGKKGRTARAMRILVAAAGSKLNKRFQLEILEPVIGKDSPLENVGEGDLSASEA